MFGFLLIILSWFVIGWKVWKYILLYLDYLEFILVREFFDIIFIFLFDIFLNNDEIFK